MRYDEEAGACIVGRYTDTVDVMRNTAPFSSVDSSWHRVVQPAELAARLPRLQLAIDRDPDYAPHRMLRGLSNPLPTW